MEEWTPQIQFETTPRRGETLFTPETNIGLHETSREDIASLEAVHAARKAAHQSFEAVVTERPPTLPEQIARAGLYTVTLRRDLSNGTKSEIESVDVPIASDFKRSQFDLAA